MNKNYLIYEDFEAIEKTKKNMARLQDDLNELHAIHELRWQGQVEKLTNPKTAKEYLKTYYLDRDEFARNLYDRSGVFQLPDDLKAVEVIAPKVRESLQQTPENSLTMFFYTPAGVKLNAKKFNEMLDQKYCAYATTPEQITRLQYAQELAAHLNKLKLDNMAINGFNNSIVGYSISYKAFIPVRDWVLNGHYLIVV